MQFTWALWMCLAQSQMYYLHHTGTDLFLDALMTVDLIISLLIGSSSCTVTLDVLASTRAPKQAR